MKKALGWFIIVMLIGAVFLMINALGGRDAVNFFLKIIGGIAGVFGFICLIILARMLINGEL